MILPVDNRLLGYRIGCFLGRKLMHVSAGGFHDAYQSRELGFPDGTDEGEALPLPLTVIGVRVEARGTSSSVGEGRAKTVEAAAKAAAIKDLIMIEVLVIKQEESGWIDVCERVVKRDTGWIVRINDG
jgi:hypothetical protein